MRHRVKGRSLGRNASHRKAMFRNMACSLILAARSDVDNGHSSGRIITTLEKAKELRPFVERLITIAKRAEVSAQVPADVLPPSDRRSVEWKAWRTSSKWQTWCAAVAPSVIARRRAFAALRSSEAVDILFSDLAPKFKSRHGGYTRVVRLASYRLGDSGRRAIIEFVGDRDRHSSSRRSSSSAPAVG